MIEEKFIFIKLFIKHSKANIQARLARHARLEKGIRPNPKKRPPQPKRSFFQRLMSPLYRFFNVGDDFPLLKKLAAWSFGFVILFFSGTLFVPLYQYTGWVPPSYEELQAMAFSEDLTNDPLNSLIDTDVGMVIKPAVQSTVGDRSESNQIFIYTVEPGDSISTIAQQFGISKETVIMENELWNSTTLRTGIQLRILPVDGVSHPVKEGDTITELAEEYEVPMEDILRQNKLEEGETLVADSSIIIPGGEKERPVIIAAAPDPVTPSGRPSSGPSAPANPGGSAAPTASGAVWPVNSCAILTQRFGGYHTGVDLACRAKGPIYAAWGGTVRKASYGWGNGYGNHIIVDHGNGLQTLYAHNETLYVNVGDYVTAGQTIAWMGNTGNVRGVTGIHLHFEVRQNGQKRNPLSYYQI